MRCIIFILATIILASCGSTPETLSQFSKRKYLKKFKKTKIKEGFKLEKAPEVLYVSIDLEPSSYTMELLPEIDESIINIVTDKYQFTKTKKTISHNVSIRKSLLLDKETPVESSYKRKIPKIVYPVWGLIAFGIFGLLTFPPSAIGWGVLSLFISSIASYLTLLEMESNEKLFKGKGYFFLGYIWKYWMLTLMIGLIALLIGGDDINFNMEGAFFGI
ncbi:MAG: hypothetical protein COA97_11540 [Flavobacteriales bacterium]|nr:MAG: hypothetical protein COA97_11540 [Flavobacteriales bacterium]